jgi:hypothetical protein
LVVAPAPLPITEQFLNRLAHECARDVYPLDTILKMFKLDEDYFHSHIMKHPRFMLFYAEAHSIWNSSANAKERSALKAAVIFEDWLAEADRLLHAKEEGLVGKVKLGEFLARVAGIDKDKSAAVAPGERVVVNINLGAAGGGIKTIEKEVPAQVIDGTATEVAP